MSQAHPSSSTPPPKDLDIALSVVASVQESIRHADTKIAGLAVLHGGMISLVLGNLPPLTFSASIPATLTAGTGLLLIIGTALAGWHLGTGFQPRLRDPGVPNRFGFPALARARSVPPVAGDRRHRREAWRLAMLLSAIAVRKHQAVRATLPWTVVCGTATVVWLVCVSAR